MILLSIICNLSIKPHLKYPGGLIMPFLIHSCHILILAASVSTGNRAIPPSLNSFNVKVSLYTLTLVVSISLLYLLQGIRPIHHLSCLDRTRHTPTKHTHTSVYFYPYRDFPLIVSMESNPNGSLSGTCISGQQCHNYN